MRRDIPVNTRSAQGSDGVEQSPEGAEHEGAEPDAADGAGAADGLAVLVLLRTQGD